MLLGALLACGIVTPQEGVSGFSNLATITVGAMFVLRAGWRKTAALDVLGRTLPRLGKRLSALLLVVTLTVGAVSAFINNSAAVSAISICSSSCRTESRALKVWPESSEEG